MPASPLTSSSANGHELLFEELVDQRGQIGLGRRPVDVKLGHHAIQERRHGGSRFAVLLEEQPNPGPYFVQTEVLPAGYIKEHNLTIDIPPNNVRMYENSTSRARVGIHIRGTRV